jgi:hypothetical protein
MHCFNLFGSHGIQRELKCVTIISSEVRVICELHFNGYFQFQLVQNISALSVVTMKPFSFCQPVSLMLKPQVCPRKT